ncbi:ribosome hibernation-promoting factor, HPF/YfiA family [Campylobacter ureolyticus]|uniref:ribosome hibernation-promoting factor, HPF/YfiA family n=1 Tax=Campylobacter ureolyticus TaxID=827 RepID=UPI0022B4CF75|nr:ribosome-associated translation inhibitor RaiA [Campylobacter ureolyticus]MCZ6172394.1 ribosome-associated translation inhibitor RaiA [Campylobacter ureolyticus]
MNTSIVGKQFDLTDTIKEYLEKAFENLEKYNLNIVSTRCVISADEKQGRKGFVVNLSINLPKKETIVISQKDKDLYAAIDSIIERASKVLRRQHDKWKTHKNKDELKEIVLDKSHDIDLSEHIDEIVEAELETHKPLEIDEALFTLKNSNDQFLVFNDMNAKMRVLYKRKDGKFGLF